MIDHVQRVAARMLPQNQRAYIIGLLHDVIEDTPVSERTLDELGFPEDIVRDVVALTRRPGESYAAFTERTAVVGSDDAIEVKLADLQDNLDHPIQSLEPRYHRAQARLERELAARRKWREVLAKNSSACAVA